MEPVATHANRAARSKFIGTRPVCPDMVCRLTWNRSSFAFVMVLKTLTLNLLKPVEANGKVLLDFCRGNQERLGWPTKIRNPRSNLLINGPKIQAIASEFATSYNPVV